MGVAECPVETAIFFQAACMGTSGAGGSLLNGVENKNYFPKNHRVDIKLLFFGAECLCPGAGYE